MSNVEKSVFISYRRTNIAWALAISKSLRQRGYDVFLDLSEIASGDFERIILANIRSRAHFVLLLTPSALERCSELNDVVRKEIEAALDSQRNIVPLMFEGIDFSNSAFQSQLTGNLSPLKRYNALKVPVDYFEEAMQRLDEKYLSTPLDVVLDPISDLAKQAADVELEKLDEAPEVSLRDLMAETFLEIGNVAPDPLEALDWLGRAINVKPDFVQAYNDRGVLRLELEDYKGAIQDLDEAIRLDHKSAVSYNNRGAVFAEQRDYARAERDYSKAIRLDPDYEQPLDNLRLLGWQRLAREGTDAIDKVMGPIDRLVGFFKRKKDS